MITPYDNLKSSAMWQVIDKTMTDLEKNNDVVITTNRDNAIGYLVAKVTDTNYDKLWLIEAKRRDKEITDNNVSCKTHSEVLKRAKKELQCR